MAKSPSTICVATVVTAESVRNLHRLADTWSGPLSVAYVVPSLAGTMTAATSPWHVLQAGRPAP